MFVSLVAVLLIGSFAWIGASSGYQYLLGVVLPLCAITVFVFGIVCRVVTWAKSPVPFAIPTVGGQQKSLDWIAPSRLDAPFTKAGVVGRMFLEVTLFRSLFRNTSAEVSAKGPRISYFSSKWLWVFALLFHYSFLVIFIRHFRFFLDTIPFPLVVLEFLDGIMQVGVPRMLLTNVLIVVAILFLIGRRLFNPKVATISLPADYFSLFLLLALVGSGICMRYFDKIDVNQAKTFIMGLVSFGPKPMDGLGPIFFVHLTFLSVLLIYFPFSKLMHMAGVFMSPTRNLPCNTREVRHENPWNNPDAPYRTYAEYEDEFREAMDEAGLPLDIPLANADQADTAPAK